MPEPRIPACGRSPRLSRRDLAGGRDHPRRRGAFPSIFAPLVRLSVSVVAGDGDRQESGSYSAGGRTDYTLYLEPETWKHAVDEALAQALTNLRSIPAPARRDDRGSSARAGRASSSTRRSATASRVTSTPQEDERVRRPPSVSASPPPGVTIVDERHPLDQRRGSLTIDDEGTPTSRTVLIEDGILKGFMQDPHELPPYGCCTDRQRTAPKPWTPADAAHDQHLHARRRQGSGRDPGFGEEGNLPPSISAAARSTSPTASSSSIAPRPTSSKTAKSVRRSRCKPHRQRSRRPHARHHDR